MTIPPRRWQRIVAGLGLAVAGCSTLSPYTPPAPELPAYYAAAPAEGPQAAPATAAVPAWWQAFGNDELDALMAEALAGNLDLQAALERVAQARAALRIAGSALLPAVGASASGTRARSAGQGYDSAYRGELSASYVVDLWGANAAGVAAATADLAASAHARAAAAIGLQSQLAALYFDHLAGADQLAIAQANLALAREVLALLEARLNAGATTGLEVAQQRAALATQEAALPPLAQRLRADEHALAVLLGRPPQALVLRGHGLADAALPLIAPGQPAGLLVRRPDIRRAEDALRGANADVAAARAAFFPQLTLSAGGGISGVLSAGSSTLASLAGDLLAPIFSGGRLEGGVEQARARYRELLASYRQTVLTACAEVEDALVAASRTAERESSLAQAARAAEQAYGIARTRYEAGAVDFLTVLDTQRTALAAADALVQGRLDRYSAAVNLYAALGGSWSEAD
ncbi:MAG: efflux transporter outer membrane subunit [Gammaproteobacteria bacterium]|nr:efflux transporter outer membrane subunit [Gammaproteobacteria bacterium]